MATQKQHLYGGVCSYRLCSSHIVPDHYGRTFETRGTFKFSYTSISTLIGYLTRPMPRSFRVVGHLAHVLINIMIPISLSHVPIRHLIFRFFHVNNASMSCIYLTLVQSKLQEFVIYLRSHFTRVHYTAILYCAKFLSSNLVSLLYISPV